MKILQICHKPPFPPIDGGAIAMNNISQGVLNAGHSLKIISVCTKKHPIDIQLLPKKYVEQTGFESVFIDTRIKIKEAFLNLFSDRSYNVERFISSEMESLITSSLKNSAFDHVILEGLYVAPYFNVIKKLFNGKITLRAHNVEYKIWDRMSLNASNPLKKKYLKLLSERLKKFEIKTYNRVDAICAMTQLDADDVTFISENKNIIAVPSGYIASDEGIDSDSIESNSIFHIASMNWQPNVEAVNWFMDKVWPVVFKQNQKAKLYLAGRDMSAEILNLELPNVVVVGEVSVAKDFFTSKEIMIVPLLSGSGMRIKIIEGMALGKVIISTSIGAEGILCTHGENILIADNPTDFANNILKVLSDKEYCAKISSNAKKLIKEKYNNDTVCENMLDFLKNLNNE